LANLFQGGGELLKLQLTKNELEHSRQAIVELFQRYLNEIAIDLIKLISDWNDPRQQESQASALICCFVTYTKRYNLPIKQLGKYETEKIPTFMSKKPKNKKNSVISLRGHNFVDYSFLSSKSQCVKCNIPFWGIGNQGLICQSKWKNVMKLIS
jgi:hypothetical protein